MENGCLILGGMHIGNNKDLSFRMAEIIPTVDIVLAENVDFFVELCQEYNLKHTDNIVLLQYDGSHIQVFNKILESLKNNKKVLVVSDCGMPTITDPGREIVNIADEAYNLINKGALTASQRKPFVELFNSANFDTLQLGIEKIFSKESLTLEVYSQLNSKIEKNNRGDLEQLLKITLSTDEESLVFLKKIEKKFNSVQGLKLEYSTETKYRPKTDQPYDVLAANSLKITGPEDIDFSSLLTIINKSSTALKNIIKLKEFKDYFYNSDPNTELGVIGNIFLNVDFLYKQALDNYIKRVIYNVQSCLGSVNNFEIHVDPIDNNIARLIDINYTGPKVEGRDSTYNKLFLLQVHNTQSTVRSYTLQSQIFPEQSAIIAIGSQAKGGQLGMQNNTMIDFNKLLIDRIVPKDEGDL